ncbi:hypothetical protein GCM10007925_17450 [Sphingomonas astaxanthinifaciens DSM 22298]|uniref:PLAT domain-containing protein n=1 Tax=Sphingomonas astaxanthinifaciens DSM 22298 TaxID=1123267 RepID=A0ABQ5Z7T1_9SPHN|nr:hypothetical protein GCM10007925_17450 [Sphingomonas astaxanthinifaciens DSM 22298]
MISLFLVAVQAASQPAPLELTCGGGGSANKAVVYSGNSYSSGSGYVGGTGFGGSGTTTTTVTVTRQQGFVDQVDVRLFNGDDRIRMPRTMLPPIHGGQDGWFKLKKVQADSRYIRATVAVNALNNPKMVIDRMTGTISLSGKAGDYTGQCQAVDVSAAPRF